jgi:ribonuclease HI
MESSTVECSGDETGCWMMKLLVYSDGASRGNPGISALAFMILSEEGELVKRYSKYVGIRTNNQVEYEAVIAALEYATKLPCQEVVCYLDSELVVKHLTGEYTVRNPTLKSLWRKVQELTKGFRRISFIHVARTHPRIREVDHLANQTLDRINSRL